MKLLIVDDDFLVCQSLQLLLQHEEDFEVLGIAENGDKAIQFCEQQAPDMILMDIQMPVKNGIDSTSEIKKRWPEILVMMLTTFKDEKNIRLALNAGAEGYVLKSSAIEKIAEQIRALKAGASVLDADVLKTIMEPSKERLNQLTERENDIVELIAQGLSNQEIAQQLFLSVGTVRNVLSIILDKLEVRDRTQLAIYYWKRNQP
ncbi:putative response regulator [Bacillus sp. TS-2]|nr:putative response regulator [Bacillus sp. TS-2]